MIPDLAFLWSVVRVEAFDVIFITVSLPTDVRF